MDHQPFVFINILNWNSYKETIDLISQIHDLDYQNFKLIVIDNNSKKDNSAIELSILAEKLNYQFVANQSNLGYAGGNNSGIKLALEQGAEFIWLLNPDIRIERDALTYLIESISSAEKIAAVGSRICFRNDKTLIYTDGGYINPKVGYKVQHLHSKKRLPLNNSQKIFEVDYANGSSILINRKALNQIGLLREDFFLYFEETEWALRAKRYDWKILSDTRAVVYHSPSHKGPRYHYYMTRNRIWLAKLNNDRESYRKTLNSELKTIYLYLKNSIFRTIYNRTKVLFAKILGLLNGVISNIK